MNENSINQVHSMLEETDTLISSSYKFSGRTIVNMIECLVLDIFLLFYSNNFLNVFLPHILSTDKPLSF